MAIQNQDEVLSMVVKYFKVLNQGPANAHSFLKLLLSMEILCVVSCRVCVCVCVGGWGCVCVCVCVCVYPHS